MEAGYGKLICNKIVDPVKCDYLCPDEHHFAYKEELKDNMTVICDDHTDLWSHMSIANPLGLLPHCTGEKQLHKITLE